MARGGLWIRSAVYVVLIVVLSNLLLLESVDRILLGPIRLAIANAAGYVLAIVHENVRVMGQRVALGASAIEVVNSCTGIDLCIFVASAMLVFPASWRSRAKGIAAGSAIIFGMNFMRVLTLCWLNADSPQLFELVHVYVWPALIMLVCLGTLLVWIQFVPVRDA